MSPERPTSRSPCIDSKPYTRHSSFSTTPDEPRDIHNLEHPLTPDMEELEGEPGFPTRAQYQVIERGYIESLTPRRRGKALISQSLFDRIWDVLHSNDNTKENAQFRFWARKMFTLSKSHSMSLGINAPRSMDQEVLLHDGLLVAVREQIYDLLCYCHGSTNHGGRDKTCALIRKHYTWVPKDLVSHFIKACPTCIVKKCGHSNAGLLSPSLPTISDSPPLPATTLVDDKSDITLPYFRDYLGDVGEQEFPNQDAYSLPSTPVNTPHSQFTFNSEHLGETPVEQLHNYNQFSLNDLNLAPGFSMMREVSLYKGLPDGWQYQNIDYRNAHAQCIEYQKFAQMMPYDASLGRTRPRVPNIAPLFGPDFEDMIDIKSEEHEPRISQVELGQSLSSGIQPDSPNLSYPVHSPVMETTAIQIDPLLLAFSTSMQPLSQPSPVSQRVALSTIINDTELAKRVPDGHILGSNDGNSFLRLKMEDLDSTKTVQDFRSMRENLDPGLMLPEGGTDMGRNNSWGNGRGSRSGNSSPASSVRSAASGLSLIVAAGSGASTPVTTAPVTPTDEVPDKAGIVNAHELGHTDTDGLDLNAVMQAVSVGAR